MAAAGTALALPARRTRAEEPVDVALVLAVDVSRSIDEDEARLQREGYRAAVSDPRVVEAIRGGMMGAIAIAYTEWAGIEFQRLVLPWTRIASAREAEAWAGALAQAPRSSLSWTSISGALDHARGVMAQCPFEATRKVIDISGDGVNNSGRPVADARRDILAKGIVLNGLAVLDRQPQPGMANLPPLDEYFRDEVIGGPSAFLMVAEGYAAFEQAVKRKIIREIAAAPPPGPLIERAFA